MAFGHLHDERLFDCYVAERGGDVVDPRSAEHLADCADCAARYAELAVFMDGLKAEADAELDEIFTPERLQAQHASIVGRLAAVGRVAHIISFPGRFVSRHMSSAGSRIAPRWLAAAAAAGLFVGVGAGQLFHTPRMRLAVDPTAAPAALPGPPPAASDAITAPVAAVPPATDDAFLSELELSIQRPRTQELLAFDAMTPHAREITVQLR
jgi:hypothetical protein